MYIFIFVYKCVKMDARKKVLILYFYERKKNKCEMQEKKEENKCTIKKNDKNTKRKKKIKSEKKTFCACQVLI